MTAVGTSTTSGRLTSIDALRGLVIVLMAVDHTRDYFSNAQFAPEDLSHGDSLLFLTRWITHFCAPIFILLAGVSAGLMSERKSTADLSKFLATRGLWLVFAEITFISFGWQFSIGPNFFITLQVIWIIGLSMLVMAALVWLPFWAILTFGGVIVLGHNILDYGLFPEASFVQPKPFWHVLHNPGFTTDLGIPAIMAYPVLPWVALMPLGFSLARLFTLPSEERADLFLKIGIATIVAFLILRMINGYGSPNQWESKGNLLFTAWSFINTQKYPPSLVFLLMTLGPAMLFLAFADRWHSKVKEVLITFGRVPFFFYILHIYLIHALALVAAELQTGDWRIWLVGFWQRPSDYGFELWVTWVMWAVVLALLYPACRWFAGLKARRKDWWLSYL